MFSVCLQCFVCLCVCVFLCVCMCACMCSSCMFVYMCVFLCVSTNDYKELHYRRRCLSPNLLARGNVKDGV